MISGSLALWQRLYWKGRKEREERTKIFCLWKSVLNYTLAYGCRELSPQIRFNCLSSNEFCKSMQM